MSAQGHFESLSGTARFLQGRANRYAWFGLALAVTALIIANVVAAYIEHRTISMVTLFAVQQTNPAIWLLDIMPLMFMTWGQYIGTVMAYQAGAMVLDETRALREQASVLEYQLTRNAPGPTTQLSGLPDRQDFVSHATKVLARRKLRAGKAALLVLDTDQYQDVEQSLGDDAALELVTQLARRLQSILGEEDYIAHFGSDDFGILLPRINDDEDSRRLASRVQLALDTPLAVQRQPMSLRLAVGIAHFPEHGDTVDLLMRRAETAKFAAAGAYRDYAVYEPELETSRAEGPRLQAELHAALNHDGLSDEYELQRPAHDGLPPRLRLAPYWQHPRNGRMDEGLFLNLPNRVSLVHSLSLWIIRDGLSRLAGWRQARPGLGLIVRLPDAAFSQIAVSDMVFRMLASHDLPPASLTLEISQRALINGAGQALSQIQQLRRQSVGICLTDVGDAGSSPAGRLYYPFDEMRTVPGLLRRAVSEKDAWAVLESFCRLARTLKLRIVLSGVIDESCRKLGESLGADYMEGAAVARRMTPTEVSGKPSASSVGL